jgi:hypothetical protein
MRAVIQPQLQLGEAQIANIVIDPKSRDDIPQLLRGLQHIYTDTSLRQRVFALLEEVMPERADGKGKASSQIRRPGMEHWKILVLGVLRLGLNARIMALTDSNAMSLSPSWHAIFSVWAQSSASKHTKRRRKRRRGPYKKAA